jgi:hypothetical protein
MPTVASLWRANAGVARALHAYFDFPPQSRLRVLRSSGNSINGAVELRATFSDDDGKFRASGDWTAYPKSQKLCFTKWI